MNPRDMVQAPAIGLMVVGGLGIAVNLLFMAFMILGASLGALTTNMNSQMGNMAQGVMGVVFYGGLAAMAALMVFGGIKMKNLSSFPLALAGCIVAVIPCYHSCCIFGLPFGIWGMVMLFKPEVQAGFKHVADGGDIEQIQPYSPPTQGPTDPPPPPPAI